jgi:hypothetical protein
MIPRHSILLLWLLFKGIAYPFNEVHKTENINDKYLAGGIEVERKTGHFDMPERKGKGNYYIDSRTGKYLGRDGDSTEEIRVIKARKFYDVCKRYKVASNGDSVVVGQPGGRKELKNSSSVIAINERIYDDIDSVDARTRHFKVEHQILIVLKIDTTGPIPKAQVISIPGPVGTRENATVKASLFEGAWRPEVDPSVILLAQVHGHPLYTAPPRNNATTTPENKSGASYDDLRVARIYSINIYAIDSYKNSNVSVGRVTPSGVQKPDYCPLAKKKNIGQEVLELFVGR